MIKKTKDCYKQIEEKIENGLDWNKTHNTVLGDFDDEEEEKYITEVSEKFDSLIKGLFELKEYIDNTQDYVSSERGELEIERIKDTLETLLNG